MRWVSWIVVLGALGWLAYAQLGPHLVDERLPGVPPDAVFGIVSPRASGRAHPSDAGEAPQPTIARIGTGSVLPYAQVYPLVEAAEATESLERVESVTTVSSRLPGVSPGEIDLSLDDGERVHRFDVGPRGQVNIPVRGDWRERGLEIRSNQPPESVNLELTLRLRPPPGPRIPYSWLWESKAQAERALEVLGEAGIGFGRDVVVGVQFEFAPGQQATLRTGQGAEASVLQADADGVIRLELRPDLLSADPVLALNPMPQRMVPLLAPAEGKDG